ncbi:hypothetical protein HII28_03180 [Planctomonas sp. JC2975]|uniref:hypothetical protein n=1 Tax=Planctomonas sp. JC2975 TaxID=2729626 RepID=UPI0014738182|nr:hypothetical protein [Planctomonas sp. JC2975]NNC10883.1 hypothetical protein [Planctomonas sp. JC2975]
MDASIIVHASCATPSPCQDTSAQPDLGWLIIPGLLIVLVVVGLIVYFGIKGNRGR